MDKKDWTEEENWVLFLAYKNLGFKHDNGDTKWNEIAKIIPGRAQNNIKNHWNSKKKNQKMKGRAQYYEL